MRLVVDGLFLRPGRVGGIEFMLYSLLSALVSAKSSRDDVRVLLPAGVALPEQPFAREVEVITVDSPGNRFAAVERRLPSDHDAALFANYYTPLTTLRRRDKPALTVVHDLQYRSFPENFTVAKRAFQHAALHVTSRLATRIVAISEFTRAEIAAAYPAARPRLSVISNPVDWTRLDAPDTVPDIGDGPVFLLAAAQYRHKNIATALAGFRLFRERRPDARLVLVGQVPEGLGEALVGEALPYSEGVHALGFVSDGMLAGLYRRADALLLPSLYEGCGLPCAEALGLGKRVVHSGRAALPEVARGLGHTVRDALDSAGWADALARVAAGDVLAPGPEDVRAVRQAHDAATVGAQYWRALRESVGEVPRRGDVGAS